MVLNETVEVRSMSVKRGLTRTKTIAAQLVGIAEQIRNHGATSSKTKSKLVDTKLSLGENHKEAEKEMARLYQQYKDLMAEYSKIKTAIAASNLKETITIGDRTMTVYEALLIENDTKAHMSRLTTAFRNGARTVENEVATYNANNQRKTDMTAADLEILQADVLYLVPRKEIAETEAFLNEFAVELHGLIDESNVLTILELN